MTLEAVVLIVVSGLTMLLIKCIDPENGAAGYYASNDNEMCLLALQFSATLVILCFAINCRFLLSHWLK